MPADSVRQIKVTLADIHPPIWRRLQVPADLRLARLHLAIQPATGWENHHMHLFTLPAGDDGLRDSEPGHRDERKAPAGYGRSHRRRHVSCTYDVGDDWVHHIEVEKVLSTAPGATYPRCLTGRRACPPEDRGGPWGYADFLAAITDPQHEQHEELLDWIGGTFDPDRLTTDAINQHLTARAIGGTCAVQQLLCGTEQLGYGV